MRSIFTWGRWADRKWGWKVCLLTQFSSPDIVYLLVQPHKIWILFPYDDKYPNFMPIYMSWSTVTILGRHASKKSHCELVKCFPLHRDVWRWITSHLGMNFELLWRNYYPTLFGKSFPIIARWPTLYSFHNSDLSSICVYQFYILVIRLSLPVSAHFMRMNDNASFWSHVHGILAYATAVSILHCQTIIMQMQRNVPDKPILSMCEIW